MLPARTVQPNAENATLEELKVAMEAAPNKRSYIRLAAIRALLMGFDALATKPRSGRPRKVKLERVGDLVLPVLDDPSLAGETHWTGRKLHGAT